MDSANLHQDQRDHCAYYWIHLKQCGDRQWPFPKSCTAIKHELMECLDDEMLHDMKEFEREKRLNARERRIREAQIVS